MRIAPARCLTVALPLMAFLTLVDDTIAQSYRELKGHIGGVESIAFSPDSSLLVSVGFDRSAKIWDVAQGTEVAILKENRMDTTCAQFSPDGKLLATGHHEPVVILSDLNTGSTLKSLPASGPRELFEGEEGHISPVTSVDFSFDGKLLATGSDDTTLRIWDVTEGKELATLEEHVNNVTKVSFHPQGRMLASCSMDGALIIWDAKNWTPRHRIRVAIDAALPIDMDVQFSPDGNSIAVSMNNEIRLYDTETGAARTSVGQGLAFAFQHDGKQIAHASGERDVQLLDSSTAAPMQTLPDHRGRVTCLAFSPDRKSLAVGNATSGVIKVWDLPSVAANASTLEALITRRKWLGKEILPKIDVAVHGPGDRSLPWRLAWPLKVDSFAAGWLVAGEAKLKVDDAILIDDARSYYTTHLLANPRSAKAYAYRSVVAHQEKQLGTAIADQTKAIELDPDLILAYRLRADSFVKKERLQDAIQDYSRTIERDTDFADAYFRRGLVYWQTDMINQALKDLSSAVERDQKHALAFFYRAKVFARLGKSEAAIRDLNRSLTLDPSQPIALVDRAGIRLARNETRRAVADCSEALRLDSDCADAFQVRSTAYASLGDREAAQADRVEFQRLSSDSPSHYANRPILHFDVSKSLFFGKRVVTVLRKLDGSVLKTFNRSHGAVWRPQGEQFAYFRESEQGGRDSLWVAGLDGKGTELLTAAENQFLRWHPVWSPDGNRLAVLSVQMIETVDRDKDVKFEVLVVDRDTLSRTNLIEVPGMFRLKLILSATGRYVVLVVGAVRDYTKVTEMRIYRLAHSKFALTSPIRTWTLESELPIHVQWSPDDTHLAAILMKDWSALTVETFRLSNGARTKVSDIRYDPKEQGVGGLDFIGFGKFLSWSD